MTDTGSLRRNAQAGSDVAKEAWKQDYWRGYLAALDDVDGQVRDSEHSLADDQAIRVHQALDELSADCSDNIRSGMLTTTHVRNWITGIRTWLPHHYSTRADD